MELVLPDRAHAASYWDAVAEYRSSGLDPSFFFGGDTLSGASTDELLARFEAYRTGRELPPGYVSATYLWLTDAGEFLGEISVRHALTDALARFGGHIGYAVRRSAWNSGNGTRMLALALPYARDALGLDRVLLTCDDGNAASARVIEKNGGVLQDRVINVIGGVKRTTRRYWICL